MPGIAMLECSVMPVIYLESWHLPFKVVNFQEYKFALGRALKQNSTHSIKPIHGQDEQTAYSVMI